MADVARAGAFAVVLALAGCAQPPVSAPIGQPVMSSPTPIPPVSLTVVMSGDFLWHMQLVATAAQDARASGSTAPYDFLPQLAMLRPVTLGADMAICQAETPITPAGTSPSGYPQFGSPAEVAVAIRQMGYDVCTTASNHAWDRGWTGLVTTLDTYHAQGILTAGTYATEAERNTPSIFTTAQGVRIAVVDGTYDLNGFTLPDDKPWSVSYATADNLIAQAKAAREAGADIVLVAMHLGEEYQTAPTAEQKALAAALTASPYVDLVYGHHVHVPQPWEQVNGKWVVYGLGNLVARMDPTLDKAWEGVVSRFTFTRTDPKGSFIVTKAEYIPVLMSPWPDGIPARLLNVTEALATGVGDRARLQTARDRLAATVTLLGATGIIES